MVGWIVYSVKDFEKNRKFINMFVDAFRLYNVELKTVILEESKYMTYTLPNFAINRSRDYHVAEYLESKGVRVFNSSKVTKIANDKFKTYKYLENIVEFMPVSKNSADIDYPKVIKSCDGHGGEQVFLAENKKQELEAIDKLKGCEYIFQKCSSDVGKDFRVYIIGNKIIEAVLRTSETSFKSNYSLGGKVNIYELSSYEKQMVEKIIKKLPMDYAGIDFIFHNNQAVFNEIEDAVGARMLYSVTSIDIVSEYVKYIIDEMC